MASQRERPGTASMCDEPRQASDGTGIALGEAARKGRSVVSGHWATDGAAMAHRVES